MDTLDLRELLFILKKGLKWIILFAVIGAVTAGAISKFVLEKQYTSSVSLYVNTAKNTEDTTINTINASQKVVNSYILLLTNDEALEQVANLLEQSVSVAAIRSSLVITTNNETQILTVSSETTDPQLSADICNALSEVAPGIYSKYIGTGDAQLIGTGAVPSGSPSSPDTKKNVFLGTLAGIVLTVIVLIIISVSDNTVKGEEDFKNRLNIPVLGEIPSFDESAKRGKRYGR